MAWASRRILAITVAVAGLACSPAFAGQNCPPPPPGAPPQQGNCNGAPPNIGGGQGPSMGNVGGGMTGGIISGRVAQAVGGIIGGAAAGSRVGPGGFGGPGGGGGTGGQGGSSSTGPTSMLDDGTSVTGMAAGSIPTKIGIWVNGGQTWLDGDQVNNDYYGVIKTALTGADVTIDGKYVLGLSAGIGRETTKIRYSGIDITGQVGTVAPYAAYIINDIFYIDTSGGVSRVLYHEQSVSQKGDNTGLRWFAGTNLNAARTFGSWSLSTNIGYLYSAERQDPYTTNTNYVVVESKSRTGQIRSTSKAGYTQLTSWGWLYPYGSVRLEYDANKTAATAIDTAGTLAANSLFGTTFGLGSSVGIGSNSSLTLEGTSTEFREHSSIYGLTATARLTF